MNRWLLTLVLPLPLFAAVAQAEQPEPYVETYYQHSYEVFVAAGNLQRARQVVENALYWRPQDMRWWQRLAQIADWQGDSNTALEAWWKVAETTDDTQAWQQVRQRAPQAYDHQLTLRVYRELLQVSPRDRELLATLARQYELLGKPDDGLAFLAGDAAADADDQVGLFDFETFPAAKLVKHFLLGFFADGAGVQQQDVGVIGVVGDFDRFAGFEQVCHAGRVVLVHLAAVGFDVQLLGHGSHVI